MTETDKLLARIGTARDAISRKTEQTSLDYMIDGVLMNCSVLLKEQEAVKIEVKKINNSGRCGRCPNCLMELNEMDYPEYCGYCGQKVKWE